MFRYVKISTDDTISIVETDACPSLVDMQALVGGYLEGLTLVGAFAYLNEDGKSLDLAANRIMTTLAHRDEAIFPQDFIVGGAS